MADLIDRAAALDMELTVECQPEELKPLMRGMNLVFQHIKELPTISLENLVKSRDIHEITNADRIRAMSDFDMADWIADILNHCDNKKPEEECLESCPLYACCNLPFDNIENWLKSPVKNGES